MNSATSVAMAITSPWIHMAQVAGRGSRSRTSSGSARPVTMPSLADRYCTTMAIRFAARTTHSSR
jgi:hypothetical protein